MSEEDLKPVIQVIVSPKTVSLGQMISIQATIYDKNTMEPMAFEKIYMEILDSRGIPVWPLSTVDENTATIAKLISTSDLQSGNTYHVRISPSPHRRPIGEAEFNIDHRIITPAFLLPGIALIPDSLFTRPTRTVGPDLLVSQPTSPKREKIESEVIGPDLPVPEMKIAWLIYTTEKDTRVCPLCQSNEGKTFRPYWQSIIKIPGDTHPRCRCHYDIITEAEYNQLLQAQAFITEYFTRHEVLNAARVASVVQRIKNIGR